MKRILPIGLIIVALVLCFQTEAYSQRGKKKSSRTDEYFDESGFTHRLWYGSHFTLGFSGNSFSSLFRLGLAPMVGYKVFDSFSIGPRGSIEFNNYRVDFGGGRLERVNPISWSIGGFARFRPFPTFFAQVEYNLENDSDVFISGNELEVARYERGAFYIGAGYNASTGGPWSFEALILYNVNQPNYISSPLDYRVGVTYNF